MSGRRPELMAGRVLAVAALASVAILVVGVAGMWLAGIDPMARPFPELSPGGLLRDLGSVRPAGFLWLGLVAAILTPSVRVGASLVGFTAAREWRMAILALAVLGVICLGAFAGAGG